MIQIPMILLFLKLQTNIKQIEKLLLKQQDNGPKNMLHDTQLINYSNFIDTFTY